ncbi:hypothetical protein PMZ80_003153 [Knufia obscura]|uniref:Uncharacterized protein n=2 Tax=Knufia TaxID=430999 RepID=A0AAN8I1L5_9EURO|nr:hypothetical protein PMZ80_003153 [Knufia obscura]KAK5949307.1 hypothetical protein OHC33_009660 [Knufia fluminis]
MTDMMFEQPSRKRAGTLTYVAPSEPAQRAKLASLEQSHSTGLVFPQHNASLFSNDPDQIQQYTAAAQLVNMSNALNSKFVPQVDFQRVMKPIKSRPGHGAARNEYPFPVQPKPAPTPNNKHLQISLPRPDPTEDLSIEPHPSSQMRPGILPLPTPPRSNPSIQSLLSASPPSTSNNVTPCPKLPTMPSAPRPSISSTFTPTSISPRTSLASTASPWPSLSSTCTTATANSSLSVPTPNTSISGSISPNTVFDSAAASLKRLLMADDMGMSPDEIRELNDFASSQSQKRNGRVLVKKKPMMRRPSSQRRVSKVSHGNGKRGSGRSESGAPGENRSGNSRGSLVRSSVDVSNSAQISVQGRGQAPPRWREVNWSRSRSRFSDSSSASAASSMSRLDSISAPHAEFDRMPVELRNESIESNTPVPLNMEVDSQDEDDESLMDIDMSELRASRVSMSTGMGMCVGESRRRRGLDMTRSVPEKVGTRAVGVVFGPCKGGYCCRSCGRCN